VLHQSPVQFSSFRMHFVTYFPSSQLICNFFLLPRLMTLSLSCFMPKKKCSKGIYFFVIVTRSMYIHFLIIRLNLFRIQCNKNYCCFSHSSHSLEVKMLIREIRRSIPLTLWKWFLWRFSLFYIFYCALRRGFMI
jgi:hypothetical protein